MSRIRPRTSLAVRLRRVFALVTLSSVLAVAGLGVTAQPASAAQLSVRQAQWDLAALGYLRYDQVTGYFGPATRAATTTFQRNRCLPADGRLTAATSDRLMSVTRQVQSRAGTYVDGLAGPMTRQAITNYQRARGMWVDGVAGPVTFARMGLARELTCTRTFGSHLFVGDPMADSATVACAPGTRNIGIRDAYYQGRLMKARLCAIPGFRSSSLASAPGSRFYVSGANGEVIVSSRVSRAVLAMFLAARADGVTLRATSSFRTREHQLAMCPCDGADVAQPGYSPHQSGVAIDFADAGGTGGHTCPTRARAATPTWRWLDANARFYGYYQYAYEAWHWDPMRMSNRC